MEGGIEHLVGLMIPFLVMILLSSSIPGASVIPGAVSRASTQKFLKVEINQINLGVNFSGVTHLDPYWI
jgi:hypothetical protein